ncbi:MAG: FISUMP domain-containing protein [Chitinophagaceae bacterium]
MKRLMTTFLAITIALLSCKKDKPTPPPTAPLVKTAALTNVTSSSATAGGSIVSDNGATVTKSGVLWSKTNATPTLTDSLVAGTATSGAFTVNINGIDFNNTYYFRAFATNSVGTGYGDVVTLTTSNDSIRFTYNGQSVTYGIIISSASGKKWLDRNLGAAQVAAAYDDYKGYGDLFQWGRPADGHQLINWTSPTEGTAVNGTVSDVTATSDTPGHSNFIIPPYDYPLDWRSVNTGNRWTTNPQAPCPAGWHVPTLAEWLAEVATTSGGTATSDGFTEMVSAYNKLKLTIAGFRGVDGPSTVSFDQTGRFGHYWSSSDHYNALGAYYDGSAILVAPDGIYQGTGFKSEARPVRCLKDN